jgi:ABC-type multidrug transport system ATPase subunit
MNQPVVKQAIKVIAVYKSVLGDSISKKESDSIIKYLNSLGPGNNLTLMDRFSDDCSKRMMENGVTGEHLVDEVLHDVKATFGYADQLLFILMMLDLSAHFDAFSGIIKPEKMAATLGISEDKFELFMLFVNTRDPDSINLPDFLVFTSLRSDQTEKLEGRWIEDHIQQSEPDETFLDVENFSGQLLVYYLKDIQSFIVRCMNNEWIEVEGSRLSECKFSLIGIGSAIYFQGKAILTYSDLKQRYIQKKARQALSISVSGLQFNPVRSGNGIFPLTVTEHSGSLVGLVGKEGTGKTTLLKLLAGHVIPDRGNVEINGYDLQRNRYLLKDIIGYVPEEDLMLEELSVYDNLLLNARLYYSSLAYQDIRQKVEHLMAALSLSDIRNTLVGNVLNKNIQPGQRRILNIALEMLREPQLLLVDNALSGLSLADSARVIRILHNYTLEGNLVITSISQVGSNIFNHFDRVWILDDGGYPVYTGIPGKVAGYLCHHLNLSDKFPEAIDPAAIFDLLNYSHTSNDDGTAHRMLSPQQWHRIYLENIPPEKPETARKSLFPNRPIKIPNLEVQYLIFSLRNFKCKFSRVNNLLFTLVSGPVVAFILGFFLRQSKGIDYIFSENSNLPAYQFISIIVSVFLGIVISSDEILKERNIVRKEQFLEFSRFSYINSKITFLLIIVALQTMLYTLIGNSLMGISGMFWPYWMVLFSVACFGILTGLFFSSGTQKLGVLYEKIIPVFLALQIIFGGGVISYHKLNLEKTKYIPAIGELMVSRWGFEALAVQQYTENLYQKNYIELDKNISRANYYTFYLIPELKKTMNKCREPGLTEDSLSTLTRIVYHELKSISSEPEVFPFEFLNSLNESQISEELIDETTDYLTYLELFFYERHENQQLQKNLLTQKLVDSLGQSGYQQLKNNHYNAELENIVTNSDFEDRIELIGDRFIRFRDGIYQAPVSNYGRAVMFTPTKIFNGQKMKTLWFNISIIWMFTTFIYLLLLTDAYNYLKEKISGFR